MAIEFLPSEALLCVFGQKTRKKFFIITDPATLLDEPYEDYTNDKEKSKIPDFVISYLTVVGLYSTAQFIEMSFKLIVKVVRDFCQRERLFDLVQCTEIAVADLLNEGLIGQIG